MAEIIKGKFGQKKPEKPKAVESFGNQEGTKELKPNLSKNGLIEIKNLKEVKKDPSVGAMITVYPGVIVRFVNALEGRAITNEVLATAEQYWKRLGDWDIISVAFYCTEEEWAKYPGRYLALAHELSRRFPTDRPEDNPK